MPGGTEVTNVAFSFDGTYLAATSKAPHILVWNLKLGKFVRSIATADRVTDLAFHPTCNDLATAVFYENACIVWNIETGEQRQVIEGHKQRITCLNYTPDGMRLVTGSDDHTLRVWDADSGEELLLIDGAPSWIRQCSISQDGRQLAYFCTTDVIKKSEITILGGSER